MRIPQWLLAGLALAAAGCPGAGPLPDRDFDDVPNERDCAPDDRARWRIVTAFPDDDLDGHGAGTPQTLCVGTELSGGYSEDATDCDDQSSSAWQLADYYVDADHDGVGIGDRVTTCAGLTAPWGYADSTGDCAHDDGARWQELGYLHVDDDGDGYSVPGAGVVCSGATLPRGYSMTEQGPDCDDGDPTVFALLDGYPDSDHDGVGSGTSAAPCTAGWLPTGWASTTGDCAPDDGSRWQELPYSFVDLDGDRYSVASFGMLCTGYGLPSAYSTTSFGLGTDCDDGDRSLFATLYGYADGDLDGFGSGTAQPRCTSGTLPSGWVSDATDCAPDDPAAWRAYSYSQRDADGDGFTVAQSGSLCVGATVPAGYGLTASASADCDDTDPTLFVLRSGCGDTDMDGYGALPVVTLCTSGALPPGYVANSTDCAPDDPASWRSLTSTNVDRDGDGYTVREAATFCFGTTPPDPYRETANGNDCDDDDPALFRWVVLYEDKDGDGVGAPPRWVPCVGAALPAGWSIHGWDSNDSDPGEASGLPLDTLLTVID